VISRRLGGEASNGFQDVVNHQVRTFRFHLLEDTIPFQQAFFTKAIIAGRLDTRLCRDWYDGARQWHSVWLSSSSSSIKNHDAYASLIHGLIATHFARPNTCALPRSFQYDLKRLSQLRTGMEDLVHLRAALIVFDELRSWILPGQAGTASSETYAELQSRILAIVDERLHEGEPWQACSADVALEITRASCAISGHSQLVVPDWLIQCTRRRFDEMISEQSMQIWESTQEELTNRAIQNAQIFNDMTPLAIADAQHQWQQQQERRPCFRPLPEVEDIARRVAHLGILHWKVWANLVYLKDDEEGPPKLGSLTNDDSRGERDY
jgi:T-complex protein 11